MNKLSKLIVPVLICTGIATISSCRPYNAGGSYSLVIWESRENRDIITRLCDNFIDYYEGKYPNLKGQIEITYIEQEEGASVSNMIANAAQGNGADVFAFVNDTLLTGIQNNILDPLEKFTPVMESIITEEAVQAVSYDDNGYVDMYAYPYAQETNVLIYLNEELDPEDVVSFETLLNAENLGSHNTAAKVLFDVNGAAQNTNSAYYIKNFLTNSRIFETTSGAQSNDPTNFVISTDENVANLYNFYTKYKGLISAASVNDALNRLTSSTPEFKVNAVITTPYNYNVLNNREELAGKLSVAALPTLDGVSLEPFNGYKAYGVSKYSTNPALAHELAYYLSTNVTCLTERAYVGVNPVLSDNYYLTHIAETAELYTVITEENECTQVVSETINNGCLMPSVNNFASYWAVMNNTTADLWAMSSYSEEAIRAALVDAEEEMRS